MKAHRLLVPLLAVVVLAGCTVVPPVAPQTSTAPTTRPVAARPAALAAGPVVATGTFGAPDGQTTGDIVITANGSSQFDYVVSNVVSPLTGQLSVEFSPVSFTDQAYCEAIGFPIYSLSQFQLAPAGTANPPNTGKLDFQNPDFFDTALLTSTDGSIPKTGCYYPVVATAELAWTLPDPRPDLVVVDGGATGGATGKVTESGGQPASYEVKPDDVLGEIAARFGITVSDLFYLNPVRDKGVQPLAYAGEVFNLLKSER